MIWSDIEPADATKIVLARPEHELPADVAVRLDIAAPHNENGERCPWPWEPQQLAGAPLGQYHCPYCGAMVIAGVPHIDYGGDHA